MDNNMDYISAATYIVFIYLIIALFIERLLEILVAVFNYLDLKFKWHRYWNRKAHAYRERFDRMFASRGSDRPEADKMLLWALWKVMTEKPYEGGKEIISACLIRHNYLRIGVRILSFLIALSFVIIVRNTTGFDLIYAINNIVPDSKTLQLIYDNTWLSILVTSIAVSLGSGPMHQLITRLENLGDKKQKMKGGANESL